MMAVFKGWIAAHTGLPSLYATGFSGSITATDSMGSRYVGNVDSTGTVISDPGAPAGELVTYTVSQAGVSAVKLTRTAGSSRLLTDRWGRGVAKIQITGDDSLDYDPGVGLTENSTGFPAVRYSLNPGSPEGTLKCLTTGADTRAIRELIGSRSPLWLIHNHSLCQVKGCDIPGTRLIQPIKYRENRTARTDIAQREWSISWRQVTPGKLEYRTPAVTWGEWETWSASHAPQGWQDWTEIQVAQRIAGLVI